MRTDEGESVVGKQELVVQDLRKVLNKAVGVGTRRTGVQATLASTGSTAAPATSSAAAVHTMSGTTLHFLQLECIAFDAMHCTVHLIFVQNAPKWCCI